MIRALHVVGSLGANTGGPARSVPSLCESLAGRGASISLVALDTGLRYGALRLPSRDLVETELVGCVNLPRLRLAWAPGLRRVLTQTCTGRDVSIVHSHGIWLPTNHTTARVARELRLPLVVSPRGMLSPWALAYRAWKKRLAFWSYQWRDLLSARLLHATSRTEAEELRALGLRQPIAVIPNGVEIPTCSKPVGADTGPRRALFLSRIHPKKGLADLVAAWKALRPPGWRAIVAGPDEQGHRAMVEGLVRAAGLEADFQFVGPVEGEAKWALYRSADLFVLPTRSENFGLVVAEALACGLPVITTKGAPWEELAQERCGWWVALGPEALEAALREAVSLPDEERRAMGRRGRTMVEERYAWPGVGARMLEVYEWLVGNGRPPACVILE